MVKKKMVLPKNFEELIETSSIDELKEIFQKIDVNAHLPRRKDTALHLSLPKELMIWLLENGADVNAKGDYNRLPIESYKLYRDDEEFSRLIDYGANPEVPNWNGNTLVFTLAEEGLVTAVKKLVESNFTITIRNNDNETPLLYMLKNMTTLDVSHYLKLAELFIENGCTIDAEGKRLVSEFARDYSFPYGYYDEYTKEVMFNDPNYDISSLVERDSNAVTDLCLLFDVEAASKLEIHNGVEPIKSFEGHLKEQHSKLWDYLVPESGPCSTVQGEIIRITGKLGYEIYQNGGINWDSDFKKMLTYLKKQLETITDMTPAQLLILEKSKGIDYLMEVEEAVSILTDLAVRFVQHNPQPIALTEELPYKR